MLQVNDLNEIPFRVMFHKGKVVLLRN